MKPCRILLLLPGYGSVFSSYLFFGYITYTSVYGGGVCALISLVCVCVGGGERKGER